MTHYSSVLERGLRFLSALVGSLWLALASPAAAADMIRALIVTGIDYPGHHWWETTPVLEEELAKDPRIQVDVFKEPDQLGAKKLAGYDVLILHFMNWGKPEPDARAKENLRSFVDHGGGLVGIHFACGAFSNWTEYPNLLGRVWDRTNTHDPRGVFRVDLVNTSHAITAGLDRSFETDDELYICLAGDKPVETLATARSKLTQRDHPMAFVHRYGNGRVFFTPLGHDVKALRATGTAELLRHAVVWSAGRQPVAPVKPDADGKPPLAKPNQTKKL